MRGLAIIAMLAGSAFGDPMSDHTKSDDALARGRRAADANQLARARVELQLAIQLEPDRVDALVELGWVEYRSKDLAAAEATTRNAIAHAKSPDTLGPALYNLGRILEDRGDKPGAIDAYTHSLQARRNATVRARLATFDPQAAAAFDRFAPTRMAGPFTSIEAFYKIGAHEDIAEHNAQMCAEYGNTLPECTRCRLRVLSKLDASHLAPPLEELEVVSRACDQVELQIAARVGGSWYVETVGPADPIVSPSHCGETEFGNAAVAMLKLAAGSAIARVSYSTAGGCSHKQINFQWKERSVVAISVGPSGLPAMTPPITTRMIETDAGKVFTDIDLDVAWKLDSTIVVTGRRTKGLPGDSDLINQGDQLGLHHLLFP